MKRILFYIIAAVVIIAGSCLIWNKINNLQESLNISRANEKALLYSKDSLNKENRVLYLTINELELYRDSLYDEMQKVRKELGIKEKEIQSLQYQLSEASRKDTVVFRDTLFRDPLLKRDTLLKDDWYSLSLHLEYPSTIIVHPMFRSEKYVFMTLTKETVNPPDDCWLVRLFQKKHYVMKAVVEERSPYIINKKQEFVQIVKKK